MKTQKRLILWFYRTTILVLLPVIFFSTHAGAQCLSSANPIGGANNLLVLEKNTIRAISFYRFNYGDQYYEQNEPSDYDLIENAFYNYIGNIIGYGLTNRLTFETEFGCFINKTQRYNLETYNKLRGTGLSNIVLSTKYGLYQNHVNRIYFSAGIGTKIPLSTKPQVKEGVELPIEVQPTSGAYGLVFQSYLVKEDSGKGLRYFLTNRTEYNGANKQNYKPGVSVLTSLYFSKHLMYHWIRGDWTAILQLRNEIRCKDKIGDIFKESSGSMIFFFSPQVNYSLKETWNFSLLIDLPVYQNFQGTQMGSKFGFSFILARDFRL